MSNKLVFASKTPAQFDGVGGSVKMTVAGDIGGNSQTAEISVAFECSGQEDLIEVYKTKDGFKIQLVGTWELDSFLSALDDVKKQFLQTKPVYKEHTQTVRKPSEEEVNYIKELLEMSDNELDSKMSKIRE